MIKPMLASPGKGIDPATLVGSHTFDLKLDGVRSMAHYKNGQLTLINRSGRQHTISYPDLVETFPHNGKGELLLDGEIVAFSGSFEHVARRDKVIRDRDIARVREQYPVQYVAFDLLHVGDQDCTVMPYRQRRNLLSDLFTGTNYQESERWHTTPFSDRLDMLDMVKAQGLEGVVAKHRDSLYRPGRSTNWLKFKNLHRITAIAVGYEPGDGIRQHFGAMFLALIDDGKPVPIGRVGTGFTLKDTHELKARLDRHEPFVVEIEAANVTRKSRQLRFPVYKGIRTDLSVADATIDQLDTIPQS